MAKARRWLAFLFSFRGKISRVQFWLGLASVLSLSVVVLVAIVFLLPQPRVKIAEEGLAWSSYWPYSAIAAKRYHDRNRSGWLLLAWLVPIVGVVGFLELGFWETRSQQTLAGPNFNRTT